MSRDEWKPGTARRLLNVLSDLMGRVGSGFEGDIPEKCFNEMSPIALATARTDASLRDAANTRRYVVLCSWERGFAAGTPTLIDILVEFNWRWMMDSQVPLEFQSLKILCSLRRDEMAELLLEEVPFPGCGVARCVEEELGFVAAVIENGAFGCRWWW